MGIIQNWSWSNQAIATWLFYEQGSSKFWIQASLHEKYLFLQKHLKAHQGNDLYSGTIASVAFISPKS